jgi:L-fuconolactonase
MQKIDAHQHFWKFDAVRDSWITNEMAVIQRDFLPGDLEPVLKENNFDGCVVVQSSQSEEENVFQLANAAKYHFINGVVGWIDLQAFDIEQKLAYYHKFEKMKGFRHVLQGEADRSLMLRSKFMNGISKLEKFNFTYDLLIFPDQLQYIPPFVSSFPNQKFVIDHIAKPLIKDGKTAEWKKEIQAVAKHENVWCKVSGLATEADWKLWKPADFTPYLDTVTEAFGTKRIMFGSDWPVCLVAASYQETLGVAKDYFSDFSGNEQEAFFGGNAVAFYNL